MIEGKAAVVLPAYRDRYRGTIQGCRRCGETVLIKRQ